MLKLTKKAFKWQVMKDRFTRGFLSGVFAGVPAFIFASITSAQKWTTLQWSHFSSVLIYGHEFRNLAEDVLATLITFFFCGLMGTIFVYLIRRISSKNYLLKGWVFSITIWFSAFAITILFRIPGLISIPFKTTLSNFIEASIWGLSLGYCLNWFDSKLIDNGNFD